MILFWAGMTGITTLVIMGLSLGWFGESPGWLESAGWLCAEAGCYQPDVLKITFLWIFRGEAALRLTAEGWYLGKVCPGKNRQRNVVLFEEFSLFVWVPAVKSEYRTS